MLVSVEITIVEVIDVDETEFTDQDAVIAHAECVCRNRYGDVTGAVGEIVEDY